MQIPPMIILLFMSLGVLLPIGAGAFDCRKATLPVELKICDEPTLKAADDVLGRAFKAALAHLSDPALRKALTKSQQRWIAMTAAGPNEYRMDGEETPIDEQAILLKMTENRTDVLLSGGLSENLNMQRDLAGQFSGGPFAGLRARCTFVPPPFFSNWDYQCSASINRQRGNRIVSKDVEWASGRETEIRYKGVIVNGAPKFEFYCETGSSPSKRCYDNENGEITDRTQIHWYPISAERSEFRVPILTDLSSLDADVNWYAEDIGWMDLELADGAKP